MTYKKGDRVEFINPSTKESMKGTVTRGGARITVDVDSGGRIRCHPSVLNPSTDGPRVSAEAAGTETFSAGDRVEVDYKGETEYGVVVKAGANLKVTLDGGERQLSGHPSLFRKSDKPLAKDDPHPMDDWGVIKYKEYPKLSRETVAFSAILTYKGEPVLEARNDGNGGGNRYHELAEKSPKTAWNFHQDATAWAKDAGWEKPIVADDFWFEWKVNRAPFGVTAKTFFKSNSYDDDSSMTAGM